MAWPTIDDLKAYCGIDYADEMVERNLNRALTTAVQTVKSAIGEDVETVLPEDSRVTELVLIYGDDLYSNRGVMLTENAKVSGTTRRLVNDIETQVRMAYRLGKEGAE